MLCAGVADDADDVLVADVDVVWHEQELSVAAPVVVAAARRAVEHRRPGVVHEDRVVVAIQPEPPGQRAGRDRRLEEAHAFRADDAVGAAAGIRGQRRKLLHVRLTCQQRPLRARRGVDGQIPILPRRPLGHLRQDESVRAHAGRGVIVGVGLRRRTEPQIKIGFAAGHSQGRAPRAVGGVLRRDLEISNRRPTRWCWCRPASPSPPCPDPTRAGSASRSRS